MASQCPVLIEYIRSHAYSAALPTAQDPFRHQAGANSHNHHELHPWGKGIVPGTKEFDALYAEANNYYMYHLWYTPALAPYMATELLNIVPVSSELMFHLVEVLKVLLISGIDAALGTLNGREVLANLKSILDNTRLSLEEKIFVRLSATSTKDSFAVNVPTTKPDPLVPDAEVILRRLLTSGRSVGRLLSLAEKVWGADPGEAIIIQRWSPEIELSREIRVFCCQGRVTAVSQDVWWEKMGWRTRYSKGFVSAITTLWNNVKPHIPFDQCTMDVLVTEPGGGNPKWKAQIIEFNGFGAHLNTGSDLFHWIRDHDILYGNQPGITVRFVDDLEEEPIKQGEESNEPDWLLLERKLRQKYMDSAKDKERLEMEKRTKLPLRGRWCSAY
ncbi:hypothetical protein B0O99DRAFT_713396 [Bisporella sp. PMI_857]|nr:hypothetical protein B0O99DRAFT_713396 [Bisporella sp. PMI_857]